MPTAVTGHSSGAIGAAYAAGILDLDSCMAISYYRGMATVELKKNFPDLKGAMMAVGCSKEEIAPIISELAAKDVRIACFNSPSSLTISGDEPAIDELQAILQKKQMFCRKLQVDVAYHSHHMKLVGKYYRDALRLLDSPTSGQVKYYSSLSGRLMDGSKLISSYWVDNLTHSVQFCEALTSMCAPTDGHKTGVNMLIEIGPHPALSGPVKQILKACGATKIAYSSALVRSKDAVETALDLASTLFVKGAILEFRGINLTRPSRPPQLLVDMPRYPWNHQIKYWHESRLVQKRNIRDSRSDLLGTLALYSNDLEPTWRNIFRIDDLPWLRHHKIQSLTLFPLAGFVSMVVEAASQRAASHNLQYDSFELRDVLIEKPLMIMDEEFEVTLQLRPYQEGSMLSSGGWDEFRIHSWANGRGWTEHCKGLIAVKSKDPHDFDFDQTSVFRKTLTEINSAEVMAVDNTKMYDALSSLGVSYGPSFQGMYNCKASGELANANITVFDTAREMPNGFETSSVVHPAFLEQLIEMYWPILGAGRSSIETIYLPSSIGHMTISREITDLTKVAGASLKAFCKGPPRMSSRPKPVQMSMFATIDDSSTETVIAVTDLTISPIVETSVNLESQANRELCYKLDWEPIFELAEFSMPNGAPNGNSNRVTNGTAASHETFGLSQTPIVIIHGDTQLQHLLAAKLADELTHITGKRPEIGVLLEMDTDGKLCLFISELEKTIMSCLTAAQFLALQKMLTKVQGILWVVRGAYVDSTNPDANMIAGLSRSVRSETLLKFATLDLDSNYVLDEEHTVKAVLQILMATLSSQANANCELEFMERKGTFFTPRIINDTEMNEYVHNQTNASLLEPAQFTDIERPLQLATDSLQVLHFVDQEEIESLADDEIEVGVRAIGMNYTDVLSITGQFETNNVGSECSGIITRVGKNVKKFAVGDRASGISVSKGVYSTFAHLKEAFSLKLINDMSFEVAASIPVAYCTAQYGLIDLGQLAAEDRVLIHGATSAAGQAAILLAQAIGADIFAIATSIEDKQFLLNSYGLRGDRLFSTHNISVHKESFDVVLNCVQTNSEMLRGLWGSLNSFGRFIELTKRDTNVLLETASFKNNKSFMSVDLGLLAIARPQAATRTFSTIAQLLEKGQIKPIPITVFPMSAIEVVCKDLQDRKTEGKYVLSTQTGDEVKASIHSTS